MSKLSFAETLERAYVLAIVMLIAVVVVAIIVG